MTLLPIQRLHSLDYEIVAPRASSLIESLRGVGYSPQTAIADIVDNSISAGAKKIWIQFAFDGADSTISILDDGGGMTEDELRLAMVLGSRSPLDIRAAGDLGRFGLGLKTASFSQCRCLTVASRKAGRLALRRWDLEAIARPNADDWRLMNGARVGSERHLEALNGLASGTLVLWEDVDRLVAGTRVGDKRAQDAFLTVMEAVEQHLGMVFHQFLESPATGLRIFINGRRVKSWDPFMTAKASPTPTESIPSSQGIIELQGFVLPHKDQLSEEEIRIAGGPEGWAAQQGFYVYRNKRMLVSGGWLGLGETRAWTMEEPYRLARIRVEFGNEADHDWDIDVKKSVARPPRWLRPRMISLAALIREQARRVFAHRGSYGPRSPISGFATAWEVAGGSGLARYRINRNHPVICRAIEASGDGAAAVDEALSIVEASVPVERIWLDTAEKGEVSEPNAEPEPPAFLVQVGRSMIAHWTRKHGLTEQQALIRLAATDPFQNYVTRLDQFISANGKSESGQ